MKRLLVVGVSGSGKSTLARAISKRLSLPFVPSDDFWWEPGWQPASNESLVAKVTEVADRDQWVLESNFDTLRHLLWPRADLIVWLDLKSTESGALFGGYSYIHLADFGNYECGAAL